MTASGQLVGFDLGDPAAGARVVFSGHNVLAADAGCGLLVIDLQRGDAVHWLRIDGMVRELYDLAVLPQVCLPMALGLKTDEIQKIVAIGADGTL